MARGFKTGGRIKKPYEWIETENGCFECVSHKASREFKGHESTICRVGGRNFLLHRLIYTELFGEIPEGMVIRHKCDNGKCINPEHMEVGTHKQNTEDMFKRGRNKNSMQKLEKEEVEEIKRLVKNKEQTQREIAKRFSVSPSTICDIKKGRTRK